MFTMEHKSSLGKVFDVFVTEPLRTHYVKEIAKKIYLAPTSVKIHLGYLLMQNLIMKKKGERFFGFVANRDNSNFLFYKRMYNIIKLKESGLLDFLINSFYPRAIVVYGSYIRGEDVETSDIDLFIITKVKKRLILEKFEEILKRRVHIIVEDSLKKLSPELKMEVINGFVLYGYLKNG